MDAILGRENLQQLPPEQQQQARSEATRQFWLNTLLSGRGLAGGFAATQEVIPGIRAAQQQREMGQAVQRSMVPQGTGLTQFGTGSQADLLAQENAMFGDDPEVTARTVEALQRNPNVPKQIDPNLYLQNVLPLVATDPSKALPLIEAGVPKLDSTLGIARDLSGRITQTFERPGQVPGTGVRMGAGGELTTRALPGASMAAAEARPPEFPQGTVVGGVQIQDFPIYQNGELVGYTRREVPMATEVPGVSGIIQDRQIREAQAETFGQETEVWDPVQRRMVRVSRAEALGYNRPPAGQRQPAQGQQGQPAQPQGQPSGVAGVGGFATGPNINEQILTEASGKAFVKKVEENQAKASTAGTRRFQAERTYDTVSRLDPTVLTAFGSAVVPFLRVIPGMRDATEQFAVDTSLIKQQWAGGVLGNFGLAKGNLNEKEVNLVEQANWEAFGPRTATRYVVTVEAALAAKDDARNKFTEEFIANGGDFRLFESEWSKSPMNQPIWNDPMMDRFITDEVTEALSRRQPNEDPKFNLPPGFRVIGGVERSGVLQGVQVEKPDGSLFIVR
jgi:hypothetical protein